MNYFVDVTLSVEAAAPPNGYGRLAAAFVITDENGVSISSGNGNLDPGMATDRRKLASYIVATLVDAWNGGSPPQAIDVTSDSVYVIWGGSDVTGPYSLRAAVV